jgi:hypothetical protein
MTDFILTFELAKGSKELDIHFDEKGLEMLISMLQGLKGKTDHDHLMTPSWAGTELSEETQSDESELINKVTIHKW